MVKRLVLTLEHKETGHKSHNRELGFTGELETLNSAFFDNLDENQEKIIESIPEFIEQLDDAVVEKLTDRPLLYPPNRTLFLSSDLIASANSKFLSYRIYKWLEKEQALKEAKFVELRGGHAFLGELNDDFQLILSLTDQFM